MSDFWARRKAAVQEEARQEELAQEVAAKAELEAVQAEKTDEELLEELGLPDPDSLGEGDDFKPFLADAIPARLKTRALRQLWKVNPVLANVDGLVDYGEDFTDAALCVENLQSAYQVGKGMLAHVEELARQAAEEEAREAEADDEPEGPETVTSVRAPDPKDKEAVLAFAAEQAEQEQAEPIEVEWDEDEQAPSAPIPGSRRMSFTFDDQRTG
ncbi:DUF3306 domain-containing protein [Tropicibacter sp. R15_0]|uniref:DUF3306 domain-containing protein n=1 Tax=Tropicibacter sp. R15_0 TaxID=2821101 RepID=UPI001ADB8B2D|nr:DUF3306 domain-containing protein [Tropicibacter sp. R15_0]MBO9463737.1 DUF3306 domain-containing protein [Tropicibacter sp. R15_0]